jgi:hypothetical protein
VALGDAISSARSGKGNPRPPKGRLVYSRIGITDQQSAHLNFFGAELNLDLLDPKETLLPHFSVVFGGHPAITPLVRSVAERIAFDTRLEGPVREVATLPRPVVLMFQSGLFFVRPPLGDDAFTEPLDQKGEVTQKSRKSPGTDGATRACG